LWAEFPEDAAEVAPKEPLSPTGGRHVFFPRRQWGHLGAPPTRLGVLVLTPVLFPHVLPRLNAAPAIVNLLALTPEPPPIDHVRSGSRPRTSERIGEILLQPSRIPTTTTSIDDRGIEPAPAFDTICTNCGPGPGSRGGTDLIAIAGPVAPPLPPKAKQLPVSVMMEGMLLRRVQPVYPEAARKMRVQGPVVLQAIISKEGRIEHLQVVSGHPFLVKAAAEAVQQWRYRPYVLNGEAVEVETLVTVNFVLAES
jgi:periplasmic protein TonB